jgi:hypothetical protein
MNTSVILLVASFLLSLVGLFVFIRHFTRPVRVPEKVRIESKKQHSEILRSSR